jgi:hypothetical protein
MFSRVNHAIKAFMERRFVISFSRSYSALLCRLRLYRRAVALCDAPKAFKIGSSIPLKRLTVRQRHYMT